MFNKTHAQLLTTQQTKYLSPMIESDVSKGNGNVV